ncbi:hypothetical protein M5E82_09215 [Parabacteroides distasonis]|nr:hypothetical protein M5E82_09215 [Parabacteroides distasonis]
MRQSLIAAGMFLLTGGMVGCGTSSTQEKEDLIVVDVSKDYPKKELILQDLLMWNIFRWRRRTSS